MDINRPFESRRSDVTRVNSHGVKLHQYMVETEVIGVGEVVITVPFPILFVERPGFFTGLVLGENVEAIAGSFPTYNATVVRWDRIQKQGENVGFFYRGATIAIVITGEESQRAYVQTHFHGKALRNPTQGLTIDGVI